MAMYPACDLMYAGGSCTEILSDRDGSQGRWRESLLDVVLLSLGWLQVCGRDSSNTVPGWPWCSGGPCTISFWVWRKLATLAFFFSAGVLIILFELGLSPSQQLQNLSKISSYFASYHGSCVVCICDCCLWWTQSIQGFNYCCSFFGYYLYFENSYSVSLISKIHIF